MDIHNTEIKKPRSQERLNGLQILRAIFCVSIIAAHCVASAEISYGLPIGAWDYPFRYSMLGFARLFLALTGFLLTGEIIRGGNNAATFAKKKALRIYPGYWVAILLAIIVRLLFLQTVNTNGHFWRIFLLLPCDTAAPYLLNGEWTLICDVLYYIIALPFLSPKRKRFFPLFVLTWLTAIIVAGCCGYWVFQIDLGFPQFFLMSAHVPFIMGCFSRYAWEKWKSKLPHIPQFALWGVIAVLLSLFIITQRGPATVGSLISIALISFVLFPCASLLKVKDTNFAVRIGNRSYGMYLAHWTVFSVLFPWFVNNGVGYGAAVYCGVMVVTLLISYIYGSFELSIGKMSRKLLSYRFPTKLFLYAVGVILTCLLILLSCALIAKPDLIPWPGV